MPTLIDLTGQRFGKLTVLKRSQDKGSNGKITKWDCLCDCGNYKAISGSSLRRGVSKSCGYCGQYKNNSKNEDIINKQFGNWIVIKEAAPTKDRHKRFLCQCKLCNREKIVNLRMLKNGIGNCYCYLNNKIKPNAKDLTGLKQGYIEVLERDCEYEKENKIIDKAYWKCYCHNCNRYFTTTNIVYSKIISCGCIKSKGEAKILQILNNNYTNVKYAYQYRNTNFRYKETNAQPIFDFALFDKKSNLVCLIEYNGAQHYQASNQGWNTEEAHLNTVKRDNEKQEICINNNIPLEIISYEQYDNLHEIISNIINKYNLI